MATVLSLFPGYVSCGGSVSLDESLWKNLPQNVIAGMIHRLPLCERVILRRVCKSWMEDCMGFMIKTPSSASDAEIQGLPVMVGDSSITIYNVKRNAWKQKFMKAVYLNDVVRGFESSGGLICAITKHSERLIVVHNPITNKTKYLLPPESFKLPHEPATKPAYLQTPRDRYLYDIALHFDGLTGLYRGMIGFLCDEERGNYTIIMASTNRGSSRQTFVYDSLNKCWSEGGEVPAGVSFWYGGDNRIVCNGSLYCLAKGRGALQGRLECKLAKYAPDSKEWIFYSVPEIPDGDHPFLVEHRKSVVYITQNEESKTLHLYKLTEVDCSNGNPWQLISRMPRELWNDFTRRADPHFARCVGQSNLIYLTGRKRKGSGVVVLAFDPSQGVYKWLPHLADDYLVFQLRCYKPSLQPV